MEKITFRPEGEEPVDFFVLEQTVIGAKSYILVTDVEDGDGEALILRDDSEKGDDEANYTIVEDDKELNAVAVVFRKLLEDDDIGLD
ncbi:DUF1292 domain-containing protein [Butyrivibrio sp. WCD3002]|jgi:uncharacterized protein YrzB (UPF0473 family)|uniref:DUF1292 domain-containing protein n=1 Tax=Butyrivibrio sp. WCD3002 TaxID=1280676 RepID=UPI0003FFFEE8|nr:DUF1292 domain-containing protein [Butyrivibrio sp. WCD3002]